MGSIKSIRDGDMSRLAPETKITGKKSLRMVRLSLVYVLRLPVNYAFNKSALGKLYSEGESGEGNTQSM